MTDANGAILQTRLVVFFTRGMSLGAWHRTGLFERELALYRSESSHVTQLAFLTYGGPEEREFQSRLDGIDILPNRWRLHSNVYSIVAPLLHAGALRRATVFKTNQLNGAWCALIAQRIFRKKLVVRFGYVWSDFYRRLGHPAWKCWLTERIEQAVLRAADQIILTLQEDRRRLIEQRGIPAAKITVIPNYVDTERFRPMPEVEKEPGLLCFIGRLEEQKNLEALLEAIRGVPGIRLMIVGEGTLRLRLERLAEAWRLPVEFVGVVPHLELPNLLNRAHAFVLPSHFEGPVKVLIEAMACGLPVIGTSVPGTREFIRHEDTGLLCGTSAEEIRAAILRVLEDAALARRMGERARHYVEQEHALPTVVERELALLAEL